MPILLAIYCNLRNVCQGYPLLLTPAGDALKCPTPAIKYKDRSFSPSILWDPMCARDPRSPGTQISIFLKGPKIRQAYIQPPNDNTDSPLVMT